MMSIILLMTLAVLLTHVMLQDDWRRKWTCLYKETVEEVKYKIST